MKTLSVLSRKGGAGKMTVALRATCIALAAALLSSGAHAEPSSRAWGLAHETCGHWNAERAKPNSIEGLAMLVWLYGFVQRADLANPQAYQAQDPDSVGAFVDNYCRAHPLNSLLRAAMLLDIELNRRAQ